MAALVLMFSSVGMMSYDNDEEFFDTCSDFGLGATFILIEEGVDSDDAICIGAFYVEVCRGTDALDAVGGLADCIA